MSIACYKEWIQCHLEMAYQFGVDMPPSPCLLQMVPDPEKLMAKARRQQQHAEAVFAGVRTTTPALGESQSPDNLLSVLHGQQEPGRDVEMEDGMMKGGGQDALPSITPSGRSGDDGDASDRGSDGSAEEGLEGVEEAAPPRTMSTLPAVEKQRPPAAAAALLDPAAEAAARQLLDDLVHRTDGWLLLAMEGLAARAARAVYRQRRQVDRVAAVALLAKELEGGL